MWKSTRPQNTVVYESLIALFVDFGECGESALKQRGRILSGDPFADRVQWPWQAAIFRDSEFMNMTFAIRIFFMETRKLGQY